MLNTACFNTASGIRLCNWGVSSSDIWTSLVSIPQAVFACATCLQVIDPDNYEVSIPQAVFACATSAQVAQAMKVYLFQYRKRYSPVQLTHSTSYGPHWTFQYRKRYSPVQHIFIFIRNNICCFNTASGIRLCNSIPAKAARVLA